MRKIHSRQEVITLKISQIMSKKRNKISIKSFVLSISMIVAGIPYSWAESSDFEKDLPSKPNLDLSDSPAYLINELFVRQDQYQHFSGVVHVKIGDSLIVQKVYGQASEGIRNQINTRFDIGSISKQFTAGAILHLVHQGLIGLNDPINPLLEGLGHSKWSKVTIHHLLTHTSGIPSIYQTEQGLEIFFPEVSPISTEELIDKFRQGKMRFKPGEEFEYSNSGYVLLAAIIEKVTDSDYFDHMSKAIFERYGLENTSFQTDGKMAYPFFGYRDDLVTPAHFFDKSWTIGAGGIISTAEDLSKWVATISSPNFLSSELRESFTKSHAQVGYGYGWQISPEGLIEHDGGTTGFISFLSFDPQTNTEIIVLTNRSFEDIHFLGKSADFVRGLVRSSWDILKGKEVEMLPIIQKSDSKPGVYFTDSQLRVEITPLNDSTIQVKSAEIQPSRIVQNAKLAGETVDELKLISIASALERKKNWGLAKYCDGEMKFVCYSGLLRVGMKMMAKQTGKVESMVPFYISDNHGLIRMKGAKGVLDLIVYFDDDGLVKGIFEHGFSEIDKELPMNAYAIGDHRYFLDGLPFGEPSLELLIENDKVIFDALGRKVVAKKESEQ